MDEALEQLARLGENGAPLAGGTWIMRSHLRGEPPRSSYVALHGLRELRHAGIGPETADLGALATHTELARLHGSPALVGLATAAARSAFPAIRSVATLGGNIGARGFAEADLVPALLAADARVKLRTADSEATLELAQYLAERDRRPPGELLLGVSVPVPASRRAAFERFTVRGGGEYAVASMALCVDLADGVVSAARVAVGSVEPQARLCEAAAATLVGAPLTAESADAAGRAAAAECAGRDGGDAPGWYREAILPPLMRRVVAQITDTEEAG
jgi:carbon-monoxide dehydrogenase medium subunit